MYTHLHYIVSEIIHLVHLKKLISCFLLSSVRLLAIDILATTLVHTKLKKKYKSSLTNLEDHSWTLVVIHAIS